MSDADTLRATMAATAPPAGLSLAVQALWWAGKGEWDRAHACVQQNEGDPACDHVHAHLHRQEGDSSNARYWYGRAGQPVPTVPLDQEWTAIAASLCRVGPGGA